MLELYIMRHGKTVWNAAGRIQGATDIELIAEGREMAAETGKIWEKENLTFDAVYSSPLQRAYETACIVSAYTGLTVQKDERLREISFGILEGQGAEWLHDSERHPQQGFFFTRPELYQRPEGGESLEEVCARADSFLQDLLRSQKEGARVLIVAHGAMNRALMTVIKRAEIKDFWEGKLQKNCAVNIVWTDGVQYEIKEEGKVFVS